jgi:hypothetical protein
MLSHRINAALDPSGPFFVQKKKKKNIQSPLAGLQWSEWRVCHVFCKSRGRSRAVVQERPATFYDVLYELRTFPVQQVGRDRWMALAKASDGATAHRRSDLLAQPNPCIHTDARSARKRSGSFCTARSGMIQVDGTFCTGPCGCVRDSPLVHGSLFKQTQSFMSMRGLHVSTANSSLHGCVVLERT